MSDAPAVGGRAPEFSLLSDTGETMRLVDLRGRWVVLFFYPAAMTPGCTAESCHFRDLAAEFTEAGAVRVGISRDSVAKQAQFADKHGFDYPLLSDSEGTVADQFGVNRMLAMLPIKRR